MSKCIRLWFGNECNATARDINRNSCLHFDKLMHLKSNRFCDRQSIRSKKQKSFNANFFSYIIF